MNSLLFVSSFLPRTLRVPGLDLAQLPRLVPRLAALHSLSAAHDDAALLAPGPQAAGAAAASTAALGTGPDPGRSAGCWLKVDQVEVVPW